MTTPYVGIEILEFVAEARNYNGWIAELVESGIVPQGTVLDFGAGRGTFAQMLRPCVGHLICVEPDSTLRDQLQGDGLEAHSDLAALPADSVASVYSLNVLEHIEDDEAALRGLWRVMAPGARLVLFVPAFPILYSSFDARFGHHRRYRRHTLNARVTKAGFRILHSRYGDSLGFFAALAFKLLDRGSGEVSRRMLRAYDQLVFPLSRALDHAAGRFFGKSLYIVAEKV